MESVIKKITEEAEKFVPALSVPQNEFAEIVEKNDDSIRGKIKYVPTPNFTDCISVGTQLPINMANEAITILSKYRAEFDFVDFIKDKLKYNTRIAVCAAFSAEQIDALVLLIKQFDVDKAFILGDSAGIGKGRVVAGMLRYAYHEKKAPVFITEKENLFTDMFEEIEAIGGFANLPNGKIISAIPFIINGYKKDGTTTIKDKNEQPIITPLQHGMISKICAKGQFPIKGFNIEFDFNCIFLTYSQISNTRGVSGENKKNFLQSIAPKAFFAFDESHNATGGKSISGEWSRKYVAESAGVLFSSATYAKQPQSFPLYVIKTAMSEAQVDLDKIEKAIDVGGENVSEYISSILVKEGQMIRRERSFDGCVVDTIYENDKELVYEKYDRSTSIFRNIYRLVNSKSFKNAIVEACYRKGEELGLDMITWEDWNLFRNGSKSSAAKIEFLEAQEGKYVPYAVGFNTLGATAKFHFKENLFIAVKAKTTAEAVIKELKTQVEYNNIDGSLHKTNRKPVIAIRNTQESVFTKLNLKVGDEFTNDFSEYIRAVIASVYTGSVTYRQVNSDFFTTRAQLEEDGKDITDVNGEFEVMSTDLPDGGALLNSYIEEANGYTSGLPLSVIDYITNRIKSEVRADWDNYGSQSPNYVVGEVTARTYMLEKLDVSDKWVVKKNERIKSVNTTFKRFNSGRIDALIINESGSTGGSIHSKFDFEDKRPRVMYILQTELDVNTEVQKRGRINRTGQVNLPSYIYVLSQVPSEMRMYLALKRKLRKLDANVSANQVQSSDIVNIKDKQGNPIEDIFNKYGEEAFQIFLRNPENMLYYELYNKVNELAFAFSDSSEMDDAGAGQKNALLPFCRELEIEPCDFQEEFYDKMNATYRTIVERHMNDGTYQLEIEIEDLKSSVKNRSVLQIGSGKSEFSKPLFIEDRFTLARKKTFTKEKIEEMMSKMANGQPLFDYHRSLVEDFISEYDTYISTVMTNVFKEPKREMYMDEEEFVKEYSFYQTRVEAKRVELEADKNYILEMIQFFRPNTNVLIPTYGTGENDAVSYTDGKFLGYKFNQTSIYNKYSRGSITFVFACLQGTPSRELKLTTDKDLLDDIKSHSYNLSLGVWASTNNYINEWKVDPNKRELTRFLTGNILSGIQYANNIKDLKDWVLTKFTNADGTTTTGIRIIYKKDLFEPLDRVPSPKVMVGFDNPEIIDFVKDSPFGYRFNIKSGLINVTRFEQDIYLEVFQIKKKGSDVPTVNQSEFNNNLFFNDLFKQYQNYLMSRNTYDGARKYTLQPEGEKEKLVQGFSRIYKFDTSNESGVDGFKRMLREH